jgi:flagellar FliL protein
MMAKAEQPGAKKVTGGISVLVMLLLSLLSIGSGAGFGMIVPGLLATPAKPKTPEPAPSGPKLPPTAILKPLAPITTNLARPATTWIRIEASIVVEKDLGPDADIIAAKVSEDLIGYLRTMTAEQLDGPSAFQHLREDLNDRVRVRSEGKATELIIQSMLIE